MQLMNFLIRKLNSRKYFKCSFFNKFMKQIITKEEKEKKTKKNQLIVGLILILLMVLSTLGYALTGRGDENNVKKVKYKDIDFLKNNDYWSFNYNGYDFATRYYPEEVKDISITNKLVFSSYTSKPLYFVTDSNQPDLEIARNLNQAVLRIQNACLSSENCTTDSPIKSCSEDNIIVIKEPNEDENEKIYQSDKCIFIIAKDVNQTRFSDAFLFNIFRI